jgi:hypothetical protein
VPTDHPYTIHVASPQPNDVELTAPLTRTGPLSRLLATYFNAFAFAAVGLFFGLMRPDLSVGRLVCLGLVGNGLIQLATLDAFSDQLPRAGRLLSGALFLAPGITNALLFHATVRFPGPTPPRALWPGFGIFMYAAAAATFATFGIPSAILWWSDVDVASRFLFDWSPLIAVGWAASILTSLLSNVGIVVVLSWKLAFVRDTDDQRRLRWVFVGCIVAIIPLIAYKIAQATLLTANPGAFREGAFRTIAAGCSAIAPLTLAYAVAKHRVLDITVIIRQGLRYLLARNALTFILLLPTFSLAYAIVANQNRTIRETLFEEPASVVLIGAAILALRFRHALCDRLDRMFFREAYDREHVLHALLDEMDRLDSIQDVSTLVGGVLMRSLHPQHVYVWMRPKEKPEFVLAHSSGHQTVPETLPADCGFVAAYENGSLAAHWRHGRSGAGAEPQWLDRLEVELVVPVVGSGRHLGGLLMLGPKKSEEPYNAGDLELLDTVAKQLAVVSENLRLKERVVEERQMLDQVVDRLEGRAINLVKECPRCGTCYDSAVDCCAADGADLAVSLPVDRLVDGQYRLERLIGKGGMGTVYEALDLRLERAVAIKFLIGRAFGDQAALRRFEREARVCARLTHPNIVTVFDYGTLPAAGAYLVMERLNGITLRDELRRIGALPAAAAADVFDQVLEGVKAAHAGGIIHRDLKPENVLLVDVGAEPRRVKLLDFGLAQLRPLDVGATPTVTVAGMVMGTVGYMAPEQLAGTRLDERADIFAVGVMLAEALIGRRPFDGPTYAAVLSSVQSQEFHLPGDTPEIRALDAVLQRCLAKDAAARFVSAADAQRELIPALRACQVAH